jgi:putative metalloenzyme radical SAM/SPASM domain maturase
VSTAVCRIQQEDVLDPPESLSRAFRNYPSKLFVETTSRCNLNCVMCMKQNGEGGADGDLSPATFEALRPALANLYSLVLNGVGEPLLNANLERFIIEAKKLMPPWAWVGFQSNGVLLTSMRAMTLADAGLDRICLSMDGASADTFTSIRAGSQLHDLQEALAAISTAKSICERPDLEVGVEYVVMRDNLAELPAALKWASDRGATFAIVSHLHPFDAVHASQCAYEVCTDEASTLFRKYQERAERSGIDMTRYFGLLWKFSRNDAEQRVVDLVEALRSEAQRGGITLDLRRHFALSRSGLDEVAEVFEQAREVARQTGLDLRLPELLPRQKRSCSFVEEGGAFVSWDGKLHPCYNLWHQCQSFANGWLQQVQPRQFGNILERGILELWNASEFRTYRANVLRHDYPFCATCNFAPCDRVQDKEFTQDCYVNSEPCGCCLWSSGVFRCLD